MKPNAVGSAPVIHCHSGCCSPLRASLSGTGLESGTNGARLAALTKKMPTTTTNTQTDTLITTSALVTHLDSRMPIIATTPSTRAMAMAPRLTVDSSPKTDVGRLSASWR